MDSSILLGVSAFGCVGCLVYVGSLLLAPGSDTKLISRLQGKTQQSAKKPATSGTALLSQLGQAMAAPFMPTQRERISSTRRNLGYAGVYSPSSVKALYGFKFIFGILGLLAGYIGGLITGAWLLCLPIGGLAGIFAPVLWLKNRIKHNQRALEYGLADALDLMVVCVEAGLTVDSAMQRVGQEMAVVHPALSRELGIAHMETRVGLTRSESLKNLGIRTGSAPLQSLGAMLIQAERFGTSIAQALRVHSDTLRLARQHRAEEQAAKTSVKMSFPLVLFIFPATFIVLAGPTVINLMHSPLMN